MSQEGEGGTLVPYPPLIGITRDITKLKDTMMGILTGKINRLTLTAPKTKYTLDSY